MSSKILIIEDNSRITSELTVMLRNMEYEANSVKFSNKLGIKAAASENPDLIICSSKENGSDIVSEIIKPLNKPIIYLNSNPSLTEQRTQSSELTELINYPIQERELTIAVEIALYKHDMEMRILESEARFKSLVENSSIGIFRLSREGRILHGNPTFLKILGYSNLKEVIGTNLGEFLESDSSNKISITELVDDSGSISRKKLELLNKSDERVIVSLGGNLVTWEDEILYFDGTIEDITKQVIYEKQLIQAKEKAEESDKLKTEFLAGMSHEIRTPINTIMNYISLLNEEMDSSEDSNYHEIFKAIEIGSLRLTRTIDAILNMAQFQSGTFDTFKTRLDIAEEILKNLCREFICTAEQKGIDLRYSNISKSSALLGDKYSLSQLFVNLIDNAIKYTTEGCVEVKVYNDSEGILSVDVTDTGIGISEAFLPALFKPFTQEEQGYTRKFDGNGLGLALVKKYCELNEGIIQVNSKKGEGTKFTVKFTQTNVNKAYKVQKNRTSQDQQLS